MHLFGGEHLDEKAKLEWAHFYDVVNVPADGAHDSIVEQTLVLEERNSLHHVSEVFHRCIEVAFDDVEDCSPELLDADVILHAELEKRLALLESCISRRVRLAPLDNVVSKLFDHRLVVKVLPVAH